MRHRGRAAALGAAALRHLAHLVLREQRDVPGDLRQHSGQDPQRGREVADADPDRVPRYHGFGQAELGGHARGDRRRAHSDRPAHLHRELVLANALEMHDRLVDSDQPAGGAQSE